MPWTTRDVSGKTKKAKSKAAKTQWVKTANAVLAKTGNEGSAIRIANAAVAKRRKKK